MFASTHFCLQCSVPIKYKPPSYNGKFCSNRCQHDWNWINVTKPNIQNGKYHISSASIIRFLTERDGYCCSKCRLTDWCGEKLTLDIDHIDGNNKNTLPSNLRYLCPNCHRQTPTWGNKKRAINSAAECHLDMVEVTSSILVSPTNNETGPWT